MVTDSKYCKQCSTTKNVSEFYKDRNGKDGINYCCKSCSNETSRKSYYPRTYGITLTDYLEKLKAQGNKCAICETELKNSGVGTHLDHDHSTGKLRDFLCSACNKGIGYFRDNTTYLLNAISYICKHDGEVKYI